MKKFKFRLERVLQFREAIKDEKLRDLILKNAKLKEDQDRLEHLMESQRQNEVGSNKVLPVEAFYMAGLYAARLKEEIINQQLLILRSQEIAQQAMAVYIEAMKEVKALTTLKERKRKEYMEYVAHEEGKFLDELATQKGNTFKSDNQG